MCKARSLLRICISLTLLLCMAAAQAQQLVRVISSGKGAAFEQAWLALSQELARGGLGATDVHYINLADVAPGKAGADEARVTVTLGTQAFLQVMAANPRGPVVAALIPRAAVEATLQQAGKKAYPAVSALYLDQPFTRQLNLLRLAMPEARTVGVIWGPESGSQRAQLAAVAKNQGLTLREGELTPGEPLITALKAAMANADVLLAVPDANVYNAATASDILLTTYRARMPVIAFSAAYVKAGAVLSLQTSATQVGVQVAAMAQAALQGTGVAGGQYPGAFVVDVNAYVARSLGLSLDAQRLTEQLTNLERHP